SFVNISYSLDGICTWTTSMERLCSLFGDLCYRVLVNGTATIYENVRAGQIFCGIARDLLNASTSAMLSTRRPVTVLLTPPFVREEIAGLVDNMKRTYITSF